MEPAARLDELRAEARHRREQRDLYKARMYGPRATSITRMRELERRVVSAEGNLSRALERSCDHLLGERTTSTADSRGAGDSAERTGDIRLR